MRWKAVNELVRINLIYSTPPTNLSKMREKQKKHPEKPIRLGRQVFLTHLFVTLLYTLFFGFGAWNSNIVEHPSIFTMMVTTFLIVTLSQGFLSFYNIFYESKDISSYLPLPFRASEVMVSKTLSSLLTIVFALLPIVCYFLTLALKGPTPVLLSLPLSILTFLVMVTSSILWIVIGVHYITGTSVFRRHKNVASNALMGLSFLIMILALMIGNVVNTNGQEASHGLSQPISFVFPPIDCLAQFILDPGKGSAQIGVILWGFSLLLGFYLLIKKVVPSFLESIQELGEVKEGVISTEKQVLAKKGDIDSFRKFVWSYHKRLFSDGTVLSQTILMNTIMPFLILAGAGIQLYRMRDKMAPAFSENPALLSPIAFMGVSLAIFMISTASLPGISISLERENFDYLKTLPFNMREYLKGKFWMALLVQSILPLLLIAGCGFLLHFPIHSILTCQLIWLLTAYPLAVYAFIWDKKHLVTNWSNLTELMGRQSSLKRNLIAYLLFFLTIIIPVLVTLLAIFKPILAYLLLGFLLIGLAGMILFAYIKLQHFLEEFDES